MQYLKRKTRFPLSGQSLSSHLVSLLQSHLKMLFVAVLRQHLPVPWPGLECREELKVTLDSIFLPLFPRKIPYGSQRGGFLCAPVVSVTITCTELSCSLVLHTIPTFPNHLILLHWTMPFNNHWVCSKLHASHVLPTPCAHTTVPDTTKDLFSKYTAICTDNDDQIYFPPLAKQWLTRTQSC